MKVWRKLMIIFFVILIIFALVVLFFIQPFSALKSNFNKTVQKEITQTVSQGDVFAEEDIAGLPEPVQKYFVHCGYIGTPKMSYMKASFKNVKFATGENKPTLKIDYTQYNFVDEPNRFAFINSSMFGITFQGFDSFSNGTGSMKGVIAKTFTLFDQRGADMDKACLVTFLSECLFVPNAALQKYITWESMDDTHAKAAISYYGISASGVFAFSDTGEMQSFTTDDRTSVDFEGNKENVPWTAVCSDYKDNNGILQPTVLKAVWHYGDGDLTYFDSDNVKIEYHEVFPPDDKAGGNT